MTALFKELDPQKAKLLQSRQKERYAPYGLTKNPFPLGGNFPEGYLQYTHLENIQERQLEDFLFSTFYRGEFNGLLILGEYGSGKSHLLNFVYEMVNSDTLKIFDDLAIAFLIQNPGLAPEDILLSLLRTIKLGMVQDLIFLPVKRTLHEKYGSNLLPFLEKFTNFQAQLKISSGTLERQTYHPGWYSQLFSLGYREFRRALKEQNVELNSKEMRKYARGVLAKELTDNSIIVESLLGLVFDDESKDIGSWESFLVSSLTGRKGQAVGVEYYLEAILGLFKIMGVQHVYLLVDELEDLRTQRISPKAATEYLAALRRMIQHNYKMFSFVLASTRDAWQELKLYYPAIDDRFPEKMDLFRNSGQVKQIIAKYLYEARNGQAVDKWFPFSERAVDRLLEIRGPILRHVMTECRRLIDLAVDAGITPPLDEEFINNNVVTTYLP